MSMSDELTVDDIIWSGGGAKSAEWPAVGSWVGGPIQSKPKKYQPTEYVKGAAPGTGKPRLTRDGNPVWGIRVDVQTTMRDPNVTNDDGVRRMHLDKWRQHEAIRNALKEAGVRQLEVGGELWMQWSGLDTESDGGQPAKTWFAKYRAPAGSAASMVDPAHSPAAQHGPQFGQQAPTLQQSYAGQQEVPGGMYGSTPVQAPVQPPAQAPVQPQTQPGPAWSSPAPVAAPTQAPAPSQPHQQPAQQPTQQPAQQPANVITQSVAAALRAQGVDTSAFTEVPG